MLKAAAYSLALTQFGALSICSADDIPLSWTAPTQNIDNTPISTICCYNVYRGTRSDMSDRVFLKQVTGLTYTDPAVKAGTWYYAVTAVTSLESDLSNIVQKVVAQPKPQAPVLK